MAEHFTTFTFDDKDVLDSFIHSNNRSGILIEDDLRDLLSTSNVHFVLSGINRLQSTLLCEAGFSYVQQSQRYVPVTDKFTKILKNTPYELRDIAQSLVNNSIMLYNEMTELKDPNKKGRLTNDDFVHGIPYEDARSILPLCMATNLVVSMSADKLIDLFRLFNNYSLIFSDLKSELYDLLPKTLYHNISISAMNKYNNSEYHSGNSYYKDKMKNLSLDNNVILLNTLDNNKTIAIGALASQNLESPDDKYLSWGEDAEEKSKKIIKNVLAYGHHGIAEHGRTTFAMECSLAAYHQIIRHRLHNIRREPLFDLLIDENREFVIPDTIKNNSKYYEEVKNLIELYKYFYKKYNKVYSREFLMQFMINSASVKFIVSSNIRNDNNIFKDRLCYTAQEEIRNLYLKKFEILYNDYPNLVKYGLPPCVLTGKCKEGKLSCGRMKEVKKEYEKFL